MAAQQSSFTRDQFLDLVRGDLGLRSQSFLTDTDLIGWGHQAQRLIAFHTHWLRKSTTANVTDGTLLVDLPTDAIAIEEVWHGTAGTDLRQLILTREDRIARDYFGTEWRANEGTPTHYYLKGGTAIGLFPTPDTTITNGVTIFYSYFPAAPSGGSATYTVPTALDYALITYAKMRACEKDRTGEGREALALYRSEWREALAQIKELIGDVAEGELTVVGALADDLSDDGVMSQLWNQTLSW